MNPIIATLIQYAIARATTSTPVPKSGATSTEFWGTGIVSVWAAISGTVPSPWNVIIPAAAVAFYTTARTALKIAHLFNRAQGIPELPEIPAAVTDAANKATPHAPVTDLSRPAQ